MDMFFSTEPLCVGAILVSFNCQVDTATHQLRGKPGLGNCLNQIGLWGSSVGTALIIDAGGPSPLRVAPSLDRQPGAVKESQLDMNLQMSHQAAFLHGFCFRFLPQLPSTMDCDLEGSAK